MKGNVDIREGLLQLFQENADLELEWEAKFLAITANRFTISQVKLVGAEEIYARHLNLPLSRLEVGTIEFREGKLIRFKAVPTEYFQNGIRRGSLRSLNINSKIEINEY